MHCLEAEHSSDIWIKAAIDFIKNQPGGTKKPFFMQVALFSPNDPRYSLDSYLEKYPANKIKVSPNFLPEFPFNQGDHHISDEILAPFPRTHHDIQVQRREYYSAITYVDYHIGRILDTLDETGKSDEIILIVTSDHNLAVDQNGLMGKQCLFDRSIWVPLIMAGPGLAAGQKVDQMVYYAGLLPTICEFIDITIPATVEKQSFADLASGRKYYEASDLLYFAYKDFLRAIRTDEFNLIEYTVKDKNLVMQRHTQLYDLKDNPFEICNQNLASSSSHIAILKDLRKQLSSLQKKYHDPMGEVNWNRM